MPYCPDSSQDGGLPYDTENYWEHVVSDYLGCSMFDVLDLDIVDFMAFRREAFIVQMSKSKEGREYLEKAKALENPDSEIERLMKRFGKGGS